MKCPRGSPRLGLLGGTPTPSPGKGSSLARTACLSLPGDSGRGSLLRSAPAPSAGNTQRLSNTSAAYGVTRVDTGSLARVGRSSQPPMIGVFMSPSHQFISKDWGCGVPHGSTFPVLILFFLREARLMTCLHCCPLNREMMKNLLVKRRNNHLPYLPEW